MDETTKNLKVRIFGQTLQKNAIRKWMTVAVLGLFFAILSLDALAEGLNRTILEVKNLYCSSCLSRINAALAELDGFTGMSADLYQGEVVIDHQAALSGADIAEFVAALGYPAKVLREGVIDSEPEVVTTQTGQGKWYSKGVGCSGCNGSYSCGGTASAWQAFYSKYFGKNRSKKDGEMREPHPNTKKRAGLGD